MSEQPRVSVILPSYNHAKYLRESINSVLNQTFSDFELIIWDDASTDESWQIINSFADPRIQAVRNDTTQRGGNTRKAISEIAAGEYIALQHSDDVWEPQKLEKQVAFLDENPEIGAVFSQALIIGENGEPFEDKTHFYYKIFDQPNRSRYEWLHQFFYNGNSLCHPSVLIRKACYDDCGPYRYGFAQVPDLDMWVRLCLKYEIHILPEKLVRFRVRANEANTSGYRPATYIRWQFEVLQIYENYTKIISSEEFIKVFPEAKKYFNQEGFDTGFVLAMLALESGTPNPTKLFGLNLLFRILNDRDRAVKINQFYGFSHKDFIALTAKNDVFSSETLSNLYIQLAGKEQMVQELNSRLSYIYSSKAWRLVQVLWRIRVAIIPHGSRRARILSNILSGLRRGFLFTGKALTGLLKSIKRNSISRRLGDRRARFSLDRLAQKVAKIYNSPVLDSPSVSIIIPVYNQIELTLNCLLSIASSQAQVDYEIIIADDASNDKTERLLKNIRGIRYIRHSTNQGFLINCNKAAEKANGEYVVFLNNDTRVHRQWLDNLLAVFSLIPSTGMVGSKLILPDGKLQEAGSLIWSDGSAMNYGRGDDPQNYLYNYVREVDYVSGASIMLPRTLWENLGGFDQKYQPAYYEDVDLAFKVRQAGYKVVYQPFSQITHYEGGSHGMDVAQGIKRYQATNREIFFNTWKNTIAAHGTFSPAGGAIQRNRYAKGEILFIDDGIPKSDHYAGAWLSEFYVSTLRAAGYAIKFLPHIDLQYSEKYTRPLQARGIECIYRPYISSSQEYIKQNGHRFDYVFLSRANVAAETIDCVKEFAPRAKVVFNTIDLHFLRFDRIAQLSGKDSDVVTARQAKETELDIMRKADCTLVVSEVERQLLTRLLPEAVVKVVPFPADIHEPQQGFEARKEIIFLGGFLHKPNVDAVIYFAKEVWPLIAKILPHARFVIAGADVTKEILQLESGRISVRGFVDNLDLLFAAAKLSVAPLRFGAGIKGKILTSLGYGVPCVASRIACEGIGVSDGTNILIADAPNEIANAVIKIYTTRELWTSLSENGQNLIREGYSRPVVASRLLKVLNEI